MIENKNGLSGKVDAAFRAAAATVIERATQTGTPVIVWEDGRTKEISSEQLKTSMEQPSGERPAP